MQRLRHKVWIAVGGQDGDLAAINRVARGTQTVSVWKDARQLGKAVGEIAAMLADGKAMDAIPGAGKFSGGEKGIEINAILSDPTPLTKDNLSVAIDGGHISKEQACRRYGRRKRLLMRLYVMDLRHFWRRFFMTTNWFSRGSLKLSQSSPKNSVARVENPSAFARFIEATELDVRLLGMIGSLFIIWAGFHLYGEIFNDQGRFLTPRNLWNLSVQTSSIGIMATGMVLVIVTRNIDLSVGSMIGVIGMCMGLLQAEILPQYLGLGHWSIWIIAVCTGLFLGALIGGFQGWLTAYLAIPSFIVTLGGLLIWRGMAFLTTKGRTIAPMDTTFALLGGGPYGAIGAWAVGLSAVLHL